MSIESFFQICQTGDVEAIREQLDADSSFDVNVKDVHDMTALAYAARNGHVDAVRELLSRGANKDEVLEQGYGRNHLEIAGLLGVAPEDMQLPVMMGEGGGSDDYAANGVVPVDVHGGQQMPDGTISYMNSASSFGQGFPMMPPFAAGAQYPAPFYPDGMHAPPAAFQSGMPRRGHGRNESNVNLPPPDIARMIPCKYFPNCKYGDKCVFAHPTMGIPAPPLPPHGHPLSPSMTHPPPMQGMFYQQMPPGYPYPAYGGAPPPFIPMSPSAQMQQSQPYGLPQHFGQPMLQSQPQEFQPNAQSSDDLPSSSQNVTATQRDGEHAQESSPSVQPDAPANAGEAHQTGALVNGTAAAQGAEVPAESREDGSEQTAKSVGQASGKPLHRRQSFNSFLHHHAVPFQPQVNASGADASVAMMNGTFVPRQTQGGKARRTAGALSGTGPNGYAGKRSNYLNGERPPCTFFQQGKCRYGDECRFPHVLADGNDVRPMQAQQRNAYASQYANGTSTRPANGNGARSNSGNSNAPASAPTGPQADKRAQQQAQQHQQETQAQSPQQQSQQTQPQQSNTPAETPQERQQPPTHQGNGKSGKGGQNGVVRSNPSKTQAAQAAATKGSGGKKQNQQNFPHHQTSQRVPNVNDFPALSSPIPNSSATSPLPTPAAPAAVNTSTTPATIGGQPSTNGAPSNAPTAPKVNFSAILSAPAPAKPKAAAAEALSANGTAIGDHEGDESASVEGAAATSSSAAKSPQVKVNGKEAPSAAPKEGKSAAAASSPVSYKAAAAAPAPVKAASDDDFQLVNRNRSTSKRPSQGSNGNTAVSVQNSDAYTLQSKAVTA